MKTCHFSFVAVAVMFLAGCSTVSRDEFAEDQKIRHVIDELSAEDGWRIWRRLRAGGAPENYEIRSNDKTGELVLVFDQSEKPTITYLSLFADDIYEQRLRSKLTNHCELSEVDLKVLSGCILAKTAMVQAMNGVLLGDQALDIKQEESWATHLFIPFPNKVILPDCRKTKDERDEADFKVYVYNEARDYSTSANDGCQSARGWGRTFTGVNNVSLDRDSRSILLESVMADDKPLPTGRFNCEVAGWFRQFLRWVRGRDSNDVNKEQGRVYSSRFRFVKWKAEYDSALDNLSLMYSELSKSCEARYQWWGLRKYASGRINDLRKEYERVELLIENSKRLRSDLEFAFALYEGLLMLKPQAWASQSVEYYKEVAKNVCNAMRTVDKGKIKKRELLDVYKDHYVETLKRELGMAPEELFNNGLIPFVPD